jgi:hypothetical protein
MIHIFLEKMEQAKGRQEEKEADNTFVLSAIMTDC